MYHAFYIIFKEIQCLWDYFSDGFMHLSLSLGSCRQETSGALDAELRNLRLVFVDLLLKHKSLAKELQSHQETDAKKKAEVKRLRGKFFICCF